MYTQTILKFSHYLPTWLWRWNRQSVPKRRHIKFRRRGITQEKTYNIPKPCFTQGHIMKTPSLPAFFHFPCYRIVSYHITQKSESHLPTHTHTLYIYIYIYIYAHTHTWCNSLEFGFQTFEDVYISHTHKSLKTCVLHVCISIQHTSVSIV